MRLVGRKLIVIPLVLALFTATFAFAAYMAGVIEIGGVFEPSVKVDPRRITLDLGRVTELEGSRTFHNVAKLVVNADNAKIKFRLDEEASYATGNLKLNINGRMQVGDKVIQMPCLFSNSGSCARVMMIIPGYDAPMEIEKGEYPVDVTLAWSVVEGSGSTTLTVIIESE